MYYPGIIVNLCRCNLFKCALYSLENTVVICVYLYILKRKLII